MATTDHDDVIIIGSGAGGETLPEHLRERKLHLHEAMDIAATAHQAGPARFVADPATSVLDVDCRAHEPRLRHGKEST